MSALKIYIEGPENIQLMEKLNNICEIIYEKDERPAEGLILDDAGLHYKTSENLIIDFNWATQWKYHKSKRYSLKKELLARALGVQKHGVHNVWDATCGTGKDTLLMMSYGLNIMSFERQETVASLLISAINDAFENEALANALNNQFSFNFGTVLDYVDKYDDIEWPDAIYFDPMFTDAGRKKKALSRKEMQIFKEVVGDDCDSCEFLEKLLDLPVKRIIVKRHPGSPKLLEGVNASFEGKSVRYDLYCNP